MLPTNVLQARYTASTLNLRRERTLLHVAHMFPDKEHTHTRTTLVPLSCKLTFSFGRLISAGDAVEVEEHTQTTDCPPDT